MSDCNHEWQEYTVSYGSGRWGATCFRCIKCGAETGMDIKTCGPSLENIRQKADPPMPNG